MRFGFDIPTRRLLLHGSTKDDVEFATRENLTAIAQRGEALGFDSLWVADHIVVPLKSQGYPYTPDGRHPFEAKRNFLEPLVSLAFVAGCTQRIRIGTSVLVVPYRNPMLAAKMLTTLDVLSGGRLIVGVGVGWWKEEFEALGTAQFGDRGARTDEYLEIMKELWTTETSSFQGRFHSFSDVACFPKPVQKPHPPIWVGGQGLPALRRTVKIGNGWHPVGVRGPIGLEPEELGRWVTVLNGLAEAEGRDPRSIEIALRVFLRFSRAESAAPLSGSPAKIVDDIDKYARAGVTHFVFDVRMDSLAAMEETLEQFASDVRPACDPQRVVSQSGGSAG